MARQVERAIGFEKDKKPEVPAPAPSSAPALEKK
jgi:hypothetical protein